LPIAASVAEKSGLVVVSHSCSYLSMIAASCASSSRMAGASALRAPELGLAAAY